MRFLLLATLFFSSAFAVAQNAPSKLPEDAALAAQLKTIAAAHHGHLAVYAENLRTGQNAGLDADLPVQTASVIKLTILLDAAEQIRAGQAKLDEKLVLTKANQVGGAGVLGEMMTPLALSLSDVLTLMVVVSDNTATNLAIDRLGLSHINATIRASGLKNTVLYKKVFVPATEPMPADQPKFGLGKTTAREIAAVMQRISECKLSLDGSPAKPGDSAICAALLDMLRHQQDRDDLPRYIEALDTSDEGTAIGNKTGALNEVRNDVAIIASKNGPIVIAAFTWDNEDQRWTGDNEAQKILARVGETVLKAWSPAGLDAHVINWTDPLTDPLSEPVKK
jgi:beta-lactamase class A